MHPNTGPRRRHSDELKALVVAACDEPGASISGVALAHGLNTNLVRKWRSSQAARLADAAVTPAAGKTPVPGTAPEFVAIEMPVSAHDAARAAAPPKATARLGEASIQIELRRGPLQLSVRWPSAASEDCRAWLSELSLSLLK